MAVQSRSFGLPNPASKTWKRESSSVFKNFELGTPPVRPSPLFFQTPPRLKSAYVFDASSYKEVNRLTDVAPEPIHRWFDTPPPPKPPYRVAISLIRGQAGAAGVTPPDTGQRFYPFPPVLLRRTDYYPPGSYFIVVPTPLVGDYDPFGGGAFFATRAPYVTGRTIGFSGNFKGPQILLPEADLPLRHWVDFVKRPSSIDIKIDISGTKLRQLLDPTSVGEGTSKFWTAAPRYRPAGPAYLVDGGKIMATPTVLIPAGSGGYDIYHYYVG